MRSDRDCFFIKIDKWLNINLLRLYIFLNKILQKGKPSHYEKVGFHFEKGRGGEASGYWAPIIQGGNFSRRKKKSRIFSKMKIRDRFSFCLWQKQGQGPRGMV